MAVQFVAEIASNHNQDLERCLRFVDVAAEVGCDAVKFQLFKIDQLFAPEVLAKSAEHRKRKEWELPLDYIPKLAERADNNGVKFSCTPFYLDAVEELLPYVDFYKIASYELLWHDLITACARTGKPLVLSTGMATMDEVGAAVTAFDQAGGSELSLLHCVSHYPTAIEECNLAAMATMRKRFDCAVGWSDHSVQPAVIQRAIHRWNAQMIEFHLDIEGEGAEFGAGHCWLPGQIGALIKEVREAERADGSDKKQPVDSELSERQWRADPADGLRPIAIIRREPGVG